MGEVGGRTNSWSQSPIRLQNIQKQAATGTSPNAVEVYVGHLSHMKTPAPPMGEQNNGFLQCIAITE